MYVFFPLYVESCARIQGEKVSLPSHTLIKCDDLVNESFVRLPLHVHAYFVFGIYLHGKEWAQMSGNVFFIERCM